MISVAVVELINRCKIYDDFKRPGGNGCLNCPLDKFSRKFGELDFGLLKKIFDDNDKMKNPIKIWELGWNGDPLLHSKISDIIEEMISRGYSINIVTNGYKFIEKINKIEKHINKLNFSIFLDSYDDVENDFLMAPGVFRDTIRAFDYLKSRNVGFSVLMRINSYNYNKIPGMMNFLKNYGATLVPFESFGGKMTDYQKLEAIKAINNYNRRDLHKTITFENPAGNCTYLRNLRIFINSDGYMSFCHFISFLDTEMVNLMNHSLEEAIKINESIRNEFVDEKMKKLPLWIKPRRVSSPCSFCYKTFGGRGMW